MKRFLIFLLIIFLSFAVNAQNSDIKTETYKVEGNCKMCKKRIEDAAYIKGVKRAEWNVDNRELTITYRASKTSPEDVLKHVAKAGHNSEKVQATDADYENLPDCCHYKTATCNH